MQANKALQDLISRSTGQMRRPRIIAAFTPGNVIHVEQRANITLPLVPANAAGGRRSSLLIAFTTVRRRMDIVAAGTCLY